LIQIFFPIVSIAFCGFIGTNELDAGSLATSIINVAVFANIHGLTSAADTLFPQIFGGEDKKKVGLVLQKGIIISLMSSLISASLLLSSKRFLVNIIHEAEILDLTDEYLVTFIPSIVFYSMATLLSKYLQSQVGFVLI
jgi:MATE family multidrug resistance protein